MVATTRRLSRWASLVFRPAGPANTWFLVSFIWHSAVYALPWCCPGPHLQPWRDAITHYLLQVPDEITRMEKALGSVRWLNKMVDLPFFVFTSIPRVGSSRIECSVECHAHFAQSTLCDLCPPALNFAKLECPIEAAFDIWCERLTYLCDTVFLLLLNKQPWT